MAGHSHSLIAAKTTTKGFIFITSTIHIMTSYRLIPILIFKRSNPLQVSLHKKLNPRDSVGLCKVVEIPSDP
jgi:hypothetical protein